ncbi:ABC transporter permease [Frondihabitans sucicola]|uniref:ABC transporter permease n=1 Tax=Frondihabitans sucicola TaxID=1268041 RepID=UPI002573DE24|nr:ABC transporter permease [Frondihabitans sucicola]
MREIRSGVATHLFAYDDGRLASGIGSMLPPAFLVLVLVLVVALLGNQILYTTVEEKETRISEILLVSITAKTLIRAKLAALAIVGLVQICVIAIPSLALLAVSDVGETFAGLELGPLVFDPTRMVLGIMILLGGLLLMTSALVTIGAMMPSAKDAAPFCSVVMIATIAPLYLVTSIIVDPLSPVASVMTYLPFFAAATALLRNAAGGLTWWEAVLVAVELFVLSALLLRFAIAAFQHGVIQYGKRVPITTTLRARARSRA